jgi:calcineurin-like phosphoesterase family protein
MAAISSSVRQSILAVFLLFYVHFYNGNLLNLNNIGNLEWHYNNTLNKLTKVNKPNTTQYYVYDLRTRLP